MRPDQQLHRSQFAVLDAPSHLERTVLLAHEIRGPDGIHDDWQVRPKALLCAKLFSRLTEPRLKKHVELWRTHDRDGYVPGVRVGREQFAPGLLRPDQIAVVAEHHSL